MVRLCVLCNLTRQQEKYHLTSRPSTGRQAVSGGGDGKEVGAHEFIPFDPHGSPSEWERLYLFYRWDSEEVTQHHIDSKKQNRFPPPVGKPRHFPEPHEPSTYPSDFFKRGARCTRCGKTAVGTVRENLRWRGGAGAQKSPS